MGYNLDILCHNLIRENMRGNIIQEILIQEYHWYNQFEEIMNESLIISFLFLIKSDHINQKTNTKKKLYRNYNGQQH